MLKHRLILGVAMIAALIGLLYLDYRLDRINLDGTPLAGVFGKSYLPRGLVMLGLVLVLISLAAGELRTIFQAKGIEADPLTLILSGALGCAFMYAIPSKTDSQRAIAAFATLMVLLFMMALLRHCWSRRTQGAMAAGAVAAFAMIYMGLLPGFYLAIRRWHGASLVAGIILVTKSCDIGAYTTGRLIGKHKLIPWLSPGKTWEGLIGGVAFSTLVAVGMTQLSNALELSGSFPHRSGDAVAVFVHRPYPIWWAILAGALLGIFGQLGDLTASLFKRDAGIKDSGSTIPGFGGLLDVFDSPIVTAPLAYWLLVLVEHHSLLTDHPVLGG